MQVAPGGVGADEDRHLQLRHEGEQARVPRVGEVLARRKVSALSRSREVEVHGDDRELARAIEHITVDTHPVAQPVAAAVVPHDAGLLGDAPGRLADDHDAALRSRVEQRLHASLRERGVGWVCDDLLGDCADGWIGDLGCHKPRVCPSRERATADDCQLTCGWSPAHRITRQIFDSPQIPHVIPRAAISPTPHKPRNFNDHNSKHKRSSRELHAKLARNSARHQPRR